MFDAHRHDECSTFDGFGKPDELAIHAKELGHTALGITNHGNTNSLVGHYFACKKNGIKPIMGVEGYFLPRYKKQNRGFHLCLFAKNLQGYENINTIQYLGEQQKYYNPIWDFDILEKYSEGVICSSACIASYLSQCIIKGNIDQAKRYLQKSIDIYGDDFYIEIQPYKVTEKGLQEKINDGAMRLAKKMGIKCILTSDSHYGAKSDFDTYLKMHEIAKHTDYEIVETYGERYMPTEGELVERFKKMHGSYAQANRMIEAIEEFEEKVDGTIFDQLSLKLPKFDPKKDSKQLIKQKIKDGLHARGKYTKKYIDRAKEELGIIFHHSFEDYFLIVSDYANWAKNQGIVVGPGRGSGCNSIVNYAMGITNVDSVYFDLGFSRFLRYDKKKMPDVDLDFHPEGRHKVLQYLLEKYEGRSAQICSYGLYRVDNLVNDLAKVCNMNNDDDMKQMKKRIHECMTRETVDMSELFASEDAKRWNKKYDNIVKHFSRLFNKIKYIGTHAAGIVITDGPILKYTAIRIDPKTGKRFTSYDLYDLERVNAIKFDILGLTTLSCVDELQKLTGEYFTESWCEDEKVIKAYSEGKTTGVFQFESKSAQEMLRQVDVSSFNDVVAVNAMNRPGPIMLKMPERYAENKRDSSLMDESLAYHKYLKETYGCVLYQEQVQAISVNIGGMSWEEADTIMKMQIRHASTTTIKTFEEHYEAYVKKFTKGAKRFGLNKDQAFEVFDKFFEYAFNKGHATGYSILSAEEMYYKVNYPVEFWYTKMKYMSADESKLIKFKSDAVHDGAILFLPHVNYSANTSLRKIEGERVIQEGMSAIKGVGPKAAEFIESERKANGIFRSFDEFYDRCKSRTVTSKVVGLLKENGCIEIDKDKYLKRVRKYNSLLYAKGLR